jgi:hypothetical protein
MAGSWYHITDDDGRFAGTARLDNMADACEALEQCYGMVQVLADRLAGAGVRTSLLLGGIPARLLLRGIPTRQQCIAYAEDHYREGLENP